MESQKNQISNEDCIDMNRLNTLTIEGNMRMNDMEPFLDQLTQKFNEDRKNVNENEVNQNQQINHQ